MDMEKLNKIGRLAECMGFEVCVQNDKYADFKVWKNGFSVEIVYDSERAVFVDEIVYISTSAVNSDDLEVFREFTGYIQKAIVIADKLKGTKVNGA